MTSTPTRQSAAAAAATTTTTHPARVLLARAHSPTSASELFTTKIKQKPLLLRATSPPAASNNRVRRRHIRLRKKAYFLRKRKPPPLSAKEKRVLGVHELKKDECKYAIYQGLHRMWVGYMQEVLSLQPSGGGRNNTNKVVTASAHGSLLATADYHGAEVEVVRSGCVDRVGLKGIVVRDTKFTFVIVTGKDEVKTLPKKDTIFRIEIPHPAASDKQETTADGKEEGKEKEVETNAAATGTPNLVFELHGSQFEFRPADRANRKFKLKATDYL